MKWSKEDTKKYLLFSKPTKTLLSNEKLNVQLVAEMDLFNNHIEYLVADNMEEIIYYSSFDLVEAIDEYYNRIGED